MTGNGTKKPRSKITRERVLLTLGIAIIVAEFINSELRGRPFHYEFLLLAAALCGISITSLGDKK